MKLTPGKQKRGKASKQAIEVFSRSRDTPVAQKGLMKGITDNECVAAMIGDVKVAVAGLAQATQVRYSIISRKVSALARVSVAFVFFFPLPTR